MMRTHYAALGAIILTSVGCSATETPGQNAGGTSSAGALGPGASETSNNGTANSAGAQSSASGGAGQATGSNDSVGGAVPVGGDAATGTGGGGATSGGGQDTSAAGKSGESAGGNSLGGSGTGGGSGNGSWLSKNQMVRLLPLGDSITAQGSCWRKELWIQLQNAGYTNIDFVGSQTAADCGGDYDSNHEGHGGVLATEVTTQEMDAWFSAANADVVLLHFATNDVWNNVPSQSILDAHKTMLEKLRGINSSVILLEAQILPMSSSACSTCQTSIPSLNAMMPEWAEEQSLPASPVLVVDQHSSFDPSADTTDGVHPYTTSGSQKIASRWFDAIVALYQP